MEDSEDFKKLIISLKDYLKDLEASSGVSVHNRNIMIH